MQAGGTVVYLDGASGSFEAGSDIFPFTAKDTPRTWPLDLHSLTWLKIIHVFKGLPVNSMMRDTYENVWARNTLRNIQTESGKSYRGTCGCNWV